MNPAEHVHHFDMGSWLLFLAYITSVVGSTVGLACTLQSRYATSPRGRIGWLLLAAVSIGGVGIWVMHFIAMLGFATPGMPVRYEIMRTALSAILSIGSVFLGLLVFGVRTNFALWRLLAGGVITGLAVNLMHYTGMAAVRVRLDSAAVDPPGVEVFTFLFPVFVLAAIALAVPVCAVLMAASPAEKEASLLRKDHDLLPASR